METLPFVEAEACAAGEVRLRVPLMREEHQEVYCDAGTGLESAAKHARKARPIHDLVSKIRSSLMDDCGNDATAESSHVL